ncbi:MAG: YncE family protein [Mycobacteriales bacterium]
MTRRLFRRQVGAMVLVVIAGCATGCHGSSPLGAAEPAVAPTVGPAPVGVVRSVGIRPEGIAVDARTGIVAVTVRDPNRLLLLDDRTLARRRAIPLPGHARHLTLAAPGGPVLVPAEDADTLVQVALPRGSTRATRVGRSPHSAAAVGGGHTIVGNEVGGTLSVLRPGHVVRTIGGLRQPGGVVAAGSLVAVVDVGSFTLTTYDLATGRRITTAKAGAGPTHAVLAAPDRLVVADTRGDELLVFDPQPLRLLSRVALPGTPYGLAADPATGTVWVTLTATNQVVGMRLTGSRLHLIVRYPTVPQPNTVAVAPGSHMVYVAGAGRGQVQLISR